MIFFLWSLIKIFSSEDAGQRYLHQIHQSIVYPCAVWQEESAPWTEIMEEEQFLFLRTEEASSEFDFRLRPVPDLSDFTMVPLRCLSEELLVLCQLLLVREGNAVDSL